jgi:hypothetical protein
LHGYARDETDTVALHRALTVLTNVEGDLEELDALDG